HMAAANGHAGTACGPAFSSERGPAAGELTGLVVGTLMRRRAPANRDCRVPAHPHAPGRRERGQRGRQHTTALGGAQWAHDRGTKAAGLWRPPGCTTTEKPAYVDSQWQAFNMRTWL